VEEKELLGGRTGMVHVIPDSFKEISKFGPFAPENISQDGLGECKKDIKKNKQKKLKYPAVAAHIKNTVPS